MFTLKFSVKITKNNWEVLKSKTSTEFYITKIFFQFRNSTFRNNETAKYKFSEKYAALNFIQPLSTRRSSLKQNYNNKVRTHQSKPNPFIKSQSSIQNYSKQFLNLEHTTKI